MKSRLTILRVRAVGLGTRGAAGVPSEYRLTGVLTMMTPRVAAGGRAESHLMTPSQAGVGSR